MANMQPITCFINDEPTLPIWWFINGTLVDYSSGYTFSGKLYRADDETHTILFTKTTGYVGQLGTGTQSSGTPNLLVDFSTTNDFNTAGLAEGRHIFQLTATKNSDSTQNTQEILIDLRNRV